jgi:hypothetical protein
MKESQMFLILLVVAMTAAKCVPVILEDRGGNNNNWHPIECNDIESYGRCVYAQNMANVTIDLECYTAVRCEIKYERACQNMDSYEKCLKAKEYNKDAPCKKYSSDDINDYHASSAGVIVPAFLITSIGVILSSI